MMEKLKFDYSLKNIPVTTERSYLLKPIEQIEMVIKRMHWKVIYCGMKGNLWVEESEDTTSDQRSSSFFDNDLFN